MNEKRKAIPAHSTPTTDDAWDGAANLALCPANADALRAMHAWQDGGRSASDPSNYKIAHHQAADDGTINEANTRACQAAIHAINENGGGIPAGDQAGVYEHLSAHLVDHGIKPAELKSARRHSFGVERRLSPVGELRVLGDSGARHLVGHAAVFNQLSEPIDFWGDTFQEKIAPGAFTKTIVEADVRALWNHNPDVVLGRNRAGTLQLSEDAIGLAFDVTLPDTAAARDLVTSIDRGDVSQNSFGFQTIKDKWEIVNTPTGTTETRTLIEVKLFDVSPVTYPAYPQTDLDVRAQLRSLGVDWDLITDILRRGRAGSALTAADYRAIDALRSCLPDEPGQSAHSPAAPPEPARWGHSLAMRRRELELLALT